MKILLAIPCYNCETQVSRMIKKLAQSKTFESEIVFINNKSQDQTRDVILNDSLRLPNKVSLLDNKANFGLGGSFKIATSYGLTKNYDYMIFLHGDDQASVEDIEKLLIEIEKDTSLEILFGARFMRRSKLKNYSKLRIFGNLVINFIFSLFTRKKIVEIGSGLNVYKLASLKKLNYESWPNHIAFDVDLLLDATSQKLNYKFFPISWEEEDQVSNAGNLSTGLLVLKMLLRWAFNKQSRLPITTTYDYDHLEISSGQDQSMLK